MDIIQNLLNRGIKLENLNIEKTLLCLSDSKLNFKSKIYAVCKCGIEKCIRLDSILKVIKRTGSYQCNSCAIKNKLLDTSYVDKHREGMKKSWTESRKSKQSIISKNLWEKDEFRKKQQQLSIKLWDDENKRYEASEFIKKLWDNLEYRKYYEQIWSNSEYKAKHSEKIKMVWQKVEYRKKFEKLWSSSEFKNKMSECIKQCWKDEDYKQKVISSQRKLWDNPEIVRQKLTKFIYNKENNLIDQVDFMFSEIQIKQLDSKIKLEKSFYSAPEEFLQSFHYAGYGRSAKIIYGAYLDDKLIAVCKFATPVRKEVVTSMGLEYFEVFELDRFCIHPQYQKKNFASWFISRCSKLVLEQFHKIKYLVSFADTTYEHFGIIYKAANWVIVHKTKPSYYYISEDGFVMHKKTLYGHACSMKKTEKEYAQEFKYEKIYGKEKIKFIYPKLVSTSC